MVVKLKGLFSIVGQAKGEVRKTLNTKASFSANYSLLDSSHSEETNVMRNEGTSTRFSFPSREFYSIKIEFCTQIAYR